ncbi:uncharacterized mitochondrial protein AtMg00810-like [Malus domestica]|uniref:uncharacterized mitochondrial protein AtMg00810-like n=1 Tax=Malus domestica TaxID=3750 RepID=UPI0007EC5895|nr:uncharacterized protein LOC108172521 [Malus domestica]
MGRTLYVGLTNLYMDLNKPPEIGFTHFQSPFRKLVINGQKLIVLFLQRPKDSGLTGAHPDKFPMEQNLKLAPIDGALLDDPTKYRRLVGRLIYLTVIRPDILFSIRTLSQFMHEPRKPHWDATLRILKYIKGTPGQGLLFPVSNNLELKAFCDSDWGGCRATKRSVTGYCVLGNSLIS